MFYYLDGTVAEILPGLAVIDCGGVGYACMTTNNTLSQLKKGEKKSNLQFSLSLILWQVYFFFLFRFRVLCCPTGSPGPVR